VRKKRKALIDAWRRKGRSVVPLEPRTRAKAEKLISAALASFDEAVSGIRALRVSGK
jgi:hypothetical protein